MKSPAAWARFAAYLFLSYSYILGSHARADDWGCQVLLCLSNPGGPTQYAACVPPIQRLWSELAKGGAFPTCSGVGFRTSQPGYQPYSCEDGYRLSTGSGPLGMGATCLSTTRQEVDSSACVSGGDATNGFARWISSDGQRRCIAYVTARPSERSQPHFLDVTIEGVGTQRVWF